MSKSREDLINIYCQFVNDNELSTADLLVLIELTVREISARGSISEDQVRRLKSMVKEMSQW